MMDEVMFQIINETAEYVKKTKSEQEKTALRFFVSYWIENTEGGDIIFQYIQRAIELGKEKGWDIEESDKDIYMFVIIAETFYRMYKPYLSGKNITEVIVDKLAQRNIAGIIANRISISITGLFSREVAYRTLYNLAIHVHRFKDLDNFNFQFVDTDGKEKGMEGVLPKYDDVFYVFSEYAITLLQFEKKDAIQKLISTLYSQVDAANNF